MEMHQPGCFKLINPQSYEEFSRGYMSLWTALHTRENIGKKNIEVRLSNIKQQQKKKWKV